MKKSENINITLELAASNNSSELGLARGSQTRRRLCDGEILRLREILEDIPAITCAAITLRLVSQFKYGFYLFLKHDIEIFITAHSEHLLILVRAGPLCKCVKYVGRGRERFLKKEVLTIS